MSSLFGPIGQAGYVVRDVDQAIYEIKKDTARFVSVEEVSKHGY